MGSKENMVPLTSHTMALTPLSVGMTTVVDDQCRALQMPDLRYSCCVFQYKLNAQKPSQRNLTWRMRWPVHARADACMLSLSQQSLSRFILASGNQVKLALAWQNLPLICNAGVLGMYHLVQLQTIPSVQQSCMLHVADYKNCAYTGT